MSPASQIGGGPSQPFWQWIVALHSVTLKQSADDGHCFTSREPSGHTGMAAHEVTALMHQMVCPHMDRG